MRKKKASVLLLIILLICAGLVFWFLKNKNNSYNNIMQIESLEFKNGSEIPSKFTCDGAGINPKLIIKNVPKEAKSLALIVDDPDAPNGTWDHWVVWNISPEITEISENSIPSGAVVGKNSWPQNEYGAPCPPSGSHRYYFKLFALDSMLDLSENSGSQELSNAMQSHILDRAELMGRYERK